MPRKMKGVASMTAGSATCDEKVAMARRKQLGWLCVLALATGALAIGLCKNEPTVNGYPLSYAELRFPLCHLQTPESDAFFHWLVLDFVLIAAYTLLWTWGLRWLARGASSPRLDWWGRSLSWLAAFAAVFDLVENLILWTGASVGATHVSPWLPVLVKLKWSSTVIAFVYGALWMWGRWRSRPPVTTSRMGAPG